MASLPFADANQVRALTETIRQLKREGLRPRYADTPGILLTAAQEALSQGLVWQPAPVAQ